MASQPAEVMVHACVLKYEKLFEKHLLKFYVQKRFGNLFKNLFV